MTGLAQLSNMFDRHLEYETINWVFEKILNQYSDCPPEYDKRNGGSQNRLQNKTGRRRSVGCRHPIE